jgi:hypothetical protein
MAEVQQQGRGHEYHETQCGEQRQPRRGLEALHAERVVEARNGEGAGDQSREIGIDHDEHRPRDDGLVGVDVARVRSEFNEVFHQLTSLSMPT